MQASFDFYMKATGALQTLFTHSHTPCQGHRSTIGPAVSTEAPAA